MFVAKMFTLSMACLALNFMLVTGECQTAKSPPAQVTYENIQDSWYGLYLTEAVLDVSRHIVTNFTVEGNEMKLCGTQENKQSDGSYVSAQFSGEFDIPENGDPRVTVRLGEPLAGLNATYTVITNYDCFLIIIGCVESLNQDSASISFNVENPPTECVDAAFAAFKEAGFNPDTMVEDTSFKS
ncbi:hypothetical protein C0J52_01379 [Blattella germanica]|nr:hypothetical protein C0J52_01379 [Blattella germanica]